MEIQVTEGKSVGTLDPWGSVARVFVNRDFRYGYFIRELDLYQMLTPEQQVAYLQGSSATLDVTPEVAQRIIDQGQTIFSKPRVIT